MDTGALLDLLGNRNRRRILQLLSRKPCYVTEISEHLGVSPKAVIDHLRKLEEAGLIESRTDDQRRKYFHIARNLRLEVTLAPYGFGMKSAYPASPNFDLSSCQHLSIEVSRGRLSPSTSENGDGTDRGLDGAELAALAAEVEELQDVERELSLAQRWVQGRMSAVLDRIAEAVDDDGYLDAEIIAAVAGGSATVEELSREVDVPPAVVEDCLDRLAEHGVVRRDGDAWALADA